MAGLAETVGGRDSDGSLGRCLAAGSDTERMSARVLESSAKCAISQVPSGGVDQRSSARIGDDREERIRNTGVQVRHSIGSNGKTALILSPVARRVGGGRGVDPVIGRRLRSGRRVVRRRLLRYPPDAGELALKLPGSCFISASNPSNRHPTYCGCSRKGQITAEQLRPGASPDRAFCSPQADFAQ